MRKQIPNAYGGHIVDVESVPHPNGLKWERVTWDYEGKTYTAKTYPGGRANDQAYEVSRRKPVLIILNGRNQVIHIERHQP
jgi:hypothetical protein